MRGKEKMNNDLISREALKEELKRYFTNGVALYQILTIIDNAPTVSPEKALMNKLKGGEEE